MRTVDNVVRVRVRVAAAVGLQHEVPARIPHLEAAQALGVAGLGGNLFEVSGATVAAGDGLVALGAHALLLNLGKQHGLLGVREAELELDHVGKTLARRGARLLVDARQLHKKPVNRALDTVDRLLAVLALDERLVRAHRVDAGAHDRLDARIAALEFLLKVLVELGVVLLAARQRVLLGIAREEVGYHVLVVDAELEGGAALEVEAQTNLALLDEHILVVADVRQRIHEPHRKCAQNKQNEPLDQIRRDCRCLRHNLV